MTRRSDVPDWAKAAQERTVPALPVTEAQLRFITTLLGERDLTHSDSSPDELRELAANLTRQKASAWIERLLALPKRPPAEVSVANQSGVPEGRYCVDTPRGLRFVKVKRPTEGRWAGYTFVDVQASDDWHPVKSAAGRNEYLSLIEQQGIEESCVRYGHELGRCGICGRTLTDEESIARGIGPVCAGRMGW